MGKKLIFGRKVGSGYSDGSKPTRYVKGTTGNPGGRPRKARQQTIDVRGAVLEPVKITRNGKTQRVPFPIAHIERLKERVVKGDPKADQAMFHLYKALGIFAFPSADSDEPFEFTLKLGNLKIPSLDDDGDKQSEESDETKNSNEEYKNKGEH